MEEFDGADDLREYVGYSPMQILAVAALDADLVDDSVGAALKHCIAQMIAGASDLLVQCGARLSLGPPPMSRLQRSGSSVSDRSDGNMSADDGRASLKIDCNKNLIKLLGGEDRLKEARDHWCRIKSVQGTARAAIQQEASKWKPGDSEAPGGSHEKSCAICWSEFGALMNRKQTCEMSMRYVCDDCSSKRVVEGNREYRVSDGQFCWSRAATIGTASSSRTGRSTIR